MITVDSREKLLIAELTSIGVEFDVQSLPLGDILMTGVVIERKTGPDLASSIVDGRFREQKARLIASGMKVIYIIEGSLQSGQMLKSSIGAITNMILRGRVSLCRTDNVGETVAVLRDLHKKITRGVTTTSSGILPPMLGKRKRCADNTGLRMLMCISGVSEGIAQRLIELYPTMKDLRSALSAKAVIRLSPSRKLGPVIMGRLTAAIG